MNETKELIVSCTELKLLVGKEMTGFSRGEVTLQWKLRKLWSFEKDDFTLGR